MGMGDELRGAVRLAGSEMESGAAPVQAVRVESSQGGEQAG